MEYSKLLLSEWGKWCRQWGFRLGYPSASPGFGDSRGHAESVMFDDDVMNAVGRAVHELRLVSYTHYEIVSDYFRERKSERDMATKYGVSRRQIRNYVREAVTHIDRALPEFERAA